MMRAHSRRPPQIDGDIARVHLGGELWMIVDASIVALATQHAWRLTRNGKTVYRGKHVGAHRYRPEFFAHIVLPPAPGMVVDHINGDPLDNRRCNLRLATLGENARNMRSRGGSSRFKGVTWHRPSASWYAFIRKDYKRTFLGCFRDEEEAARAYDVAARTLHGEFARLNFPRDGERSALVDDRVAMVIEEMAFAGGGR